MQRSIPHERLSELIGHEGLTSIEAAQRLEDLGPNTLVPQAGRGWKVTVANTLHDPMLWFLLAIALLFATMGNWTEAVVLLLAIIPLFGMDVFLHQRTQASTEGLMSRLAQSSVVRRDGKEQTLKSDRIVPGDRVKVLAGGFFPADGLLMEGDDLQVDESSLTGESWPVRKALLPESFRTHSQGSVSVSSEHWGLAGTRLLTGEAWLYVVFTGEETLYGDIAHTARLGRQARTPLQQAVTRMVRYLIVASVVACLVLAGLRLVQGHGLIDALLSALTLAIAALPEEFPVVLTFFLGAGVYRLARRHALVRRAVAVENVGRVTCICSDKTGTLTEGQLSLAKTLSAPSLDESQLLALAAGACDPTSHDPLDEAILDVAKAPAWDKVTTFAFTEDRRKASTVYQHEGGYTAIIKGAPETILALSQIQFEEQDQWLDDAQAFSEEGYKVIACARKDLDSSQWTGQEPEDEWTFLGLLAFEDPLRVGVEQSIEACQKVGIHVVMVTGDHPGTALAIARKIIGPDAPLNLIAGEELADRMGELCQPCQGLDVIARATPAQKLMLVETLQAQGQIVAVTGDGVNDVPALQAADVGIAMGERGTQSAREAAAIVLMNDNFSTIVGAIAEGRQLFINLQRSFQYLLMVHFPLVLSAALIPMMGYPLLFLPAHLVWMELIIHPTALLVFQDRAQSIKLAAPSLGKNIEFFNVRGWLAIVTVGLLATGLVMGAYLWGLETSGQVEHGRTIAVMSLVMISSAITATLSRMRTRASWMIVVAAPLLSAALVYAPPMAQALHLGPLHWDDWGLATLAAIAVGFITTLGIGWSTRATKHRRMLA